MWDEFVLFSQKSREINWLGRKIGGGRSWIRTSLSLQIREMQGDFAKMQGDAEHRPAKNDWLSIVWMQSPYSRSRETIILSREIRESRLANVGHRQTRGQKGECVSIGALMSGFIPSGYLSIREALNRLGRELFPSDWTGEEHKARRGLISEDRWLSIKDLPPPRGTDAPGGGRGRGGASGPVTARVPARPDDPSSPAYQAEYQASERYASARDHFRALLERRELEAVILDPFTGELHRASVSLWRRHNADRMIEKGEAPLPWGRNTGRLLVKHFAEKSVPAKPIPQAKIQKAIEALKEKIATESLTRSQQKEFLRKSFPSYHLTERQLNQIYRAVPVPTGRPKKSGK